ncbi:transmembrane protein 56-B isoform X2 [Selaginella moellendorffii]|nr:transmembrane protein 56-B isoform X2 [Selaginella moellendorffii]|eukprot:XP_002971044.2 transmembrane protein 56-B isoform X2 [Selaginella moellendorffii]
MDKAELFNRQMWEVFGERGRLAEPLLWLASIAVGIVFCKSVYDNMESSFSQIKVYRALARRQQIEWSNRGFSTAHAIVVSTIAAYLLVYSDFFSDAAPYGPVVFRSTIFSQAVLGFSIGYFIADLSMIIWCYPDLGGWVYILHHGLSIASLALALHSGYAHIYLYLVLFSEFTTPFVNLRWYLSTAGQSGSNAYLLNGILLFLTWLIFRVLLFVYFFTHIYLHFDQVRQMHDAGFYFLFIAPPLLALMNLVWFRKISLGVVKAFKKKQK